MNTPAFRLTTPELKEVHRSAARISVVVCAAIICALLLAIPLTGDVLYGVGIFGPVVIIVLALTMERTGNYRAELLVITGSASIIVSQYFWNRVPFDAPAMVGLALVSTAGVLLVADRWKRIYLWTTGLVLFATAQLWEGISADGLTLGAIAGTGSVAIMFLLLRVRDAAIASGQRHQLVIENLPVPLMEQDWTDVRAWLKARRDEGIEDLDSHLDACPGALEEVLDLIALRTVNPAMSMMVANDFDSLPDSKNLFGVANEEILPYLRSELLSLWDGRTRSVSQFRASRRNGDDIWLQLASTYLDPGVLPNVDRLMAIADVTELKKAQTELSNQIESKDEFVAAVSLELRTPLTTILGFAEIIETNAPELTPETQEMFHLLLSQANDMAHIVEDLLVAARAEIGNVSLRQELVSLGPSIRRAVKTIDPSFATHIHDEAVVKGDPVRITQIIRNLASNAKRYGGEDRSIHLTREADIAVVEVLDNGEGIPIEHRERVFEAYARAHERPGLAASVGLGLTVSRQLAELMGGTIVYSREGGYSIFRLALPLTTRSVD